MLTVDKTANDWLPPPPSDDLRVQIDASRRHYDRLDAENVTRRLGRDFEIHLRAEPCGLRPGLYHIVFDVRMEEMDWRALQARVDGYNAFEAARRILGKDTRELYRRLNRLALRVGALSVNNLVALAVYFGICPLAIMHEALLPDREAAKPLIPSQKYAAGARRSAIRSALVSEAAHV